MPQLDWQRLITRRPRLEALRLEIVEQLATAEASLQRRPPFCAHELWYGPGGIKREMIELLKDRGMAWSAQAYWTAYAVLYDLLPECRHPQSDCRACQGDWRAVLTGRKPQGHVATASTA
jgi:hypothetical protein